MLEGSRVNVRGFEALGKLGYMLFNSPDHTLASLASTHVPQKQCLNLLALFSHVHRQL